MDTEPIRQAVVKAIAPLKAADDNTLASKNFLFEAKRTDAGRQLPPYYLVYFLLIDLLGFKNLGRFEKIDWSVPVDFNGQAFLIEHRKFGVGVFAASLPKDEAPAAEIVTRIKKAVKIAQPYFDWRAEQAVKDSKLNVLNSSRELFERYQFLSAQYEAKRAEAERRAHEKIVTPIKNGSITKFPAFSLRREAKWLALSVIESFFSWTEHVFIHLAILQGACQTGDAVATLAAADWTAKYKAALEVADPDSKRFYDELIVVRRQLRNFVAHGAFGKQGEAFQFHSSAGAVPVRLFSQDGAAYRFGSGVDFVDHDAIVLIQEFVDHLWSGSRAPARIYLQEYELPIILTMVDNGTYAQAMQSEEDMTEFAHHLAEDMDRHANMDF